MKRPQYFVLRFTKFCAATAVALMLGACQTSPSSPRQITYAQHEPTHINAEARSFEYQGATYTFVKAYFSALGQYCRRYTSVSQSLSFCKEGESWYQLKPFNIDLTSEESL